MRTLIVLVLGCWCILSAGCHRRDLEDNILVKGSIPVSIDWSVCGITPQNVTMLFYNENDGSLALKHYFENNSNPIQTYVNIPPGLYNVAVFNELPNQVNNVQIEGMDNFSTLEAIGVKKNDVILPFEENYYIKEPGQLAVVMVEEFNVTYDMLNDNYQYNCTQDGREQSCRLMGVKPLIKTTIFDIIIHVKGLNNARMPVLVSLGNLSGSYLFEENRNGVDPVSYQFTINNRIYDPESTTHGTVSGQASIFGILGQHSSITSQLNDSPIILMLNFMLADKEGTIITEIFDITDDIDFSNSENGTVHINLNLSIETPLPEVGPGVGDSGFGTNVANWDEVNISIDAE